MIPLGLHKGLLALAVGVAISGLATTSLAAEAAKSTTAPAASGATSSAADAARLMVSKDVIGKSIHGEQNITLGTVEEVIVDRNGVAQYLVIAPAKDLNLGSKRIAVPWTALSSTKEGAWSLAMSKDKFSKAPTWSDKQAAAKDWDTKTYDYFGLVYVAEKAQFSQLDANKDKQLSQDEAQANRRIGSNFKNLDKDSNGSISESEFSAFEEMMPSSDSSPMM